MEQIEKARKILAIAAKQELEQMDAKEYALARKSWGIANTLADLTAFKGLKKLTLFLKTESGNVTVDVMANQDVKTKLMGIVGDLTQTVLLGAWIVAFNPAGITILAVEVISQVLDWDLGSVFKKIHYSGEKWAHNIAKITLYNGVWA